ncbi:hypothetical protein Lal_00011079 [Lupinus albus]|nr:hypothetical protein Lal_00011079 [Lupinus albus]
MHKLAGDAVSAGVPMLNGSAPAAISLPFGNPGIVPAAAFPSQIFPTPVAEPVGVPSECLLLKNMFDPSTETDPDFDLDIKEDVEEECSKYGRVKHIYVDKKSAGFVYLRFETVKASSDAQHALHMRWFARKLISAIFMVLSSLVFPAALFLSCLWTSNLIPTHLSFKHFPPFKKTV